MSEVSLPALESKAIPVRNAWLLLLYAWDMARWCGRWQGTAESAPNLMGLLARVLVDCTSPLLRQQLGRAYQRQTEQIRGIRGRIDFPQSLKRLSFQAGAAVCAYGLLTIDSPKNRILRSTLDRLARSPLIHAGAGVEAGQLLRHDLRAVVRAMDGVELIGVQRKDFAQLQLGRNDVAYRLPLAICYLIHRYEMPSETAGNDVLARLLRDEIVFSELFERFVRNFYRYHVREAKVGAEDLSWFDEIGSTFVPRMRTDITMEWGYPVERRLVIDTKYYANTLSSRFEGSEKFHSGNLYQLYTYLRTQEHRSPAHRHAPGVLLYPTTSKPLNERMSVQGHEMRVVTVDLSKPWPDIEAALLQIVDAQCSNASALSPSQQ